LKADPAVREVRALFRPRASDGWYAVGLSARGEQWSASLPAPRADLDGFVYLIEVADAVAERTRTAEYPVRVVSEAADCGSERAGPSVADALPIVEAPGGGVGVPPGFGDGSSEGAPPRPRPRGVEASKGGVFDLGARTSVLVGLGVTAAAVGVALAVGGDSEPAPGGTVDFLGSVPAPGSDVSLSAFSLALRLRIESDEDLSSGSVLVSLLRSGAPCLDMWAPHTGMARGRPVEVTVDRALSVGCDAPFVVSQATVTIRGPGESDRFSRLLPLAFTFVP